MLTVTLDSDKPIVAVVDDEPEITDLLAIELEDDYTVVQFNEPMRFVEAIAQKTINPDVLVTDLKMPKLTGLQMLQKVNELGTTFPAIMFSGHLEKEDAIKAIELGVIHILEKPVDVTAVHEAVNASLVDAQILKTRAEIRDLLKSLKEVTETIRGAITQYVPKDVQDRLFISTSGNPVPLDVILDDLEVKMEFLSKEDIFLAKAKQAQYKQGLQKQAR